MRFVNPRSDFPISTGVVHDGPTMELVLTGLPARASGAEHGIDVETSSIFSQLDAILEQEGLTRQNVCSARLYLQDVQGEIATVNRQWKEYFGDHPANRRAYGVQLQRGMRIEAAFVVEMEKKAP